jgi:hypothetical protein
MRPGIQACGKGNDEDEYGDRIQRIDDGACKVQERCTYGKDGIPILLPGKIATFHRSFSSVAWGHGQVFLQKSQDVKQYFCFDGQ